MTERARESGRDGRADAPTERESVWAGASSPLGALVPGADLGGRYRIVSWVGVGGMGEVWRAFDLKLRVDVALKALREDLIQDERRRELLRQEVRAAREVVSPNVCRIFDLVEAGGRELVSMEYVDGQTLLRVLQERGPLELKEAQDIASQFLAGLEAIHGAGLVHRDVKPENIMLTRTGRVVVMDFGLARSRVDPARSASGTPAYMAPEQARREADGRADLYSAGVVLAEMVCPEGVKDIPSRESVWDGVRADPPKLADTPWAPVLRKAVARQPDQRYGTAHALARALEEVTLRVVGGEDLHPYPGLASFTEADAEFFFGREAEVEQMWRKLEGPARLLGLAGPSGAGKSSFLRAGLIPSARPGWAIVICTPGSDPLASLRRAVISELGGDTEALRELAVGSDDASVAAIARWRRHHDHALVIIDQFEELFTQTSAESQSRFGRVLGRLALEGDAHVLLSIREDFLLRCHDHEPLEPLFSELTPLAAPAGAALRRALTQPALRCGYRFEDEALVAEMLAEVEGERGALPLLAFAAARLWEKRDRDDGLLTRQAHLDIGGVGGALAQHAEATMDRIGSERVPIVRELFRNLVTAEGTRAVREWDELLSVFADSRRESAREVLRALVDARLLTSYELRREEGEPTRQVEVIHESLISHWPRLQRWQTQDADAAQLRDQLRQAARTWQEHGRTDDMLWTGSAYREFAVWREHYPGGLTELEEAFAAAMDLLATRRRRRRQVAAVAGVAVLLAVLAVVTGLWRRSVQQTRRAEAAKLLALAQARLADDPTEALALTTASLEVADTREAREFAVRVLWTAPPAFDLVHGEWEGSAVTFSPDGRRLAVSHLDPDVTVWSEDGHRPIRLGGHSVARDGGIISAWAADDLLVTGHESERRARVWSIPDGTLLRVVGLVPHERWAVGSRRLFGVPDESSETGADYLLRSWRLPDGQAEALDSLSAAERAGVSAILPAPDGSGWVVARGSEVFFRPFGGEGPERLLETLEGAASLRPHRDRGVLVADEAGNLRRWSFGDGEPRRVWAMRGPAGLAGMDFTAAVAAPGRLASLDPTGQSVWVWQPECLPGARPLELRHSGSWFFPALHMHPAGDLVVATTQSKQRLSFWPLARRYPSVVEGYKFAELRRPLAFSPDSRWLATGWEDGSLRLLPVEGGDPDAVRELRPPVDSPSVAADLSFDPKGRYLFAVYGDAAWVVPLDGGAWHEVAPRVPGRELDRAAISPSGERVATAFFGGEGDRNISVFEVATGELVRLPLPSTDHPGEELYDGICGLDFLDEQTLLTTGLGGMWRWDIATGSRQLVMESPGNTAESLWNIAMWVSRAAGIAVTVAHSRSQLQGPELTDLATWTGRPLRGFGQASLKGWIAAFDPSGTVLAVTSWDGTIRVGRPDGGEAHLLLGHTGCAFFTAISPDLRWVASAGEDNTLRLWPMPDLSKPPLHTLPHDELLAKLKSLTNLRAVRDPASDTGYSIELDPFPGWAVVPEWNP